MSFTPGDPASVILGPTATKDDIQRLNEQLGYYQPFFVRYVSYVARAVQGDFGLSYRSQNPVLEEIFTRFPTTLRLAICSILLSVLLGAPLGILSAVRQYSWFDMTATIVAMFMASMPGFWLGLMGIWIFSLKLGWLPSIGISTIRHYILPVFTLALPCAATILRLTRSAMLEIIRQDYIRTARAKGAPERTIIIKHAFRNALLPIVTVVGINFGLLLGGAVLIESVFGIPGVGTLTINSIRMKDIPQTTASVLFLALTYVVMMLIVDVLYAYIDPRIKAKYMTKRVGAHG